MQLVIYKITNLINDKVYVGKSKQYKIRWKQHIDGHNDSYISRAIKKYGLSNFEFEVVDYTEDEQKLCELEYKWIKKLNSLAPVGYNLVLDCGSRIFTDPKIKVKCFNSTNKENNTGFRGVYLDKRINKYEANINFNSKQYTKRFESVEKAAEAYDKIALYFYGFDIKLNFPGKLEEYKKEDLKRYGKWFCKKREDSSIFFGVCAVGKFFRAYFYDENKKQIALDCYKTSREAALVRDKILVYLYGKNLGKKKLNFPKKADGYDKEELEKLYNKIMNRETSKHRGVSKKANKDRWISNVQKDGKFYHLGTFGTEEEAYQARLKKEKELGWNNKIIKK